MAANKTISHRIIHPKKVVHFWIHFTINKIKPDYNESLIGFT